VTLSISSHAANLDVTLVVIPPNGPEQQHQLGSMPGGVALPESEGILSFASFHAGAGARVFLVREGSEVVVYQRPFDEESGWGEARQLGSAAVPAAAWVHYTVAAPSQTLTPPSGCADAASVRFSCGVEGGSPIYLCQLDDRLRFGFADEHEVHVYDMPQANVNRSLALWRRTAPRVSQDAVVVTVDDRSFGLVDEWHGEEHTQGVYVGPPSDPESLTCEGPARVDFEPLFDSLDATQGEFPY